MHQRPCTFFSVSCKGSNLLAGIDRFVRTDVIAFEKVDLDNGYLDASKNRCYFFGGNTFDLFMGKRCYSGNVVGGAGRVRYWTREVS